MNTLLNTTTERFHGTVDPRSFYLGEQPQSSSMQNSASINCKNKTKSSAVKKMKIGSLDQQKVRSSHSNPNYDFVGIAG